MLPLAVAAASAAAEASGCSIAGLWCDIVGRCSNAPINISAVPATTTAPALRLTEQPDDELTAAGCAADPSRWPLRATADCRPHWGPLCEASDAAGKRYAQIQLGSRTVRGAVTADCGAILWADDAGFSAKGWCRVGTSIDGHSCAGKLPPPPPPCPPPGPPSPHPTPPPPPPAPTGPPPVDSVTFAVDDEATPRNLTSDFWDNESWQPSNYPATRFLLDLADPLLTLLPFSRRRSPVDAAAPVAAQVKGITNVVRVLGGW